MGFWNLLLSFAPWIVFKICVVLPLADKLTMVKAGIVLAALICFWQAASGLHKGVILWGGLLFFGFSLVSVVFFTNIWVVMHLGVLSHGTLAGLTWASILAGKPFTMAYAKAHVPPALWGTRPFLRKNALISGIWGLAFSVNLVDALIKLSPPPVSPEWVFEVVDNLALLGAILLTVRMSRPRRSPAGPEAAAPEPETV